MPNKTVSGWTQVPVVASDLMEVKYTRLNGGGTANNLSVTYEVRDNTGAVRFVATHGQQVGSYPVSIAAILSAINATQGT